GRLRVRKSSSRPMPPASDTDPRTAQALAARAEYPPRPYSGTISLTAPSEYNHSGCDAARVWEGYADRVVVERVDGDHLTMMQEDGGPPAVASVVDRPLGPPPPPPPR